MSSCESTNVFKKENRLCPFSSSKPRKKKGKKAFSVKEAADLASSDQRFFYNHEESLQKIDKRNTSGQLSSEMSASRSKMQLDEVKDDQEDVGSWAKLSGRTIVSGENLQGKLQESVSCRFCHGNVELQENVSLRTGLGSTWIICCGNESCPSHVTNSSFETTEKRKDFEINPAAVLGLRTVGCGHTTASKFLSFLGLAPVSINAWAEHTKTIEEKGKSSTQG